MNRRVDLNDVRLLMQVVEHGSYTAAARAIGIPKSTISQRISSLEVSIGTGLLRRTSRSFSLTEAGAQLLPHARAIEEVARQVEHTLMDHEGELQGVLRVSCSHAIGQFAVSPLVPRFLEKHARVAIKVETTNRLVGLITEGFDMVVRGHVGALRDSTLIQRVVARTPWVLAASPGWLREHGEPQRPEDVPVADTLCFSSTPEALSWTMRQGEDERPIAISPRMISDDMLSLRTAAVAGGGVACLPAYVMAACFHSGELARVLPGWVGQTSCISVLTPPRAQSSRLASAFSGFLASQLPAVVQA